LFKQVDLFWVALVVLLFITATATLAPLIFHLDPYKQDLHNRLLPPAWMPGGTSEHVLGMDQLGRDTLVRLIFGARISLMISFGSVLGSQALGITLGIVSGYVGGRVDALLMRAAEIQMAFPFMVSALVVLAVVQPGILTFVIVFTIAGWPVLAKVTRGLTLSLRDRDYVEAARALGGSTAHVLFWHILPNILPYVLVLATLQVPNIIFSEAGLSFLGVGLNPPEPSWGAMLGEGRDYLGNAWWLGTFPGLAIMTTVLSLNFIGDSLGERLSRRG